MQSRLILIVLAIFAAFSILLGRDSNSTRSQTNLSSKERGLFSHLRSFLKEYGFSTKYADYWQCTSRFETANFSSNLYRNFNNPWGMMQPVFRPTRSAGPVSIGYASYDNLKDAAKDLVLYMVALNYPKQAPPSLKAHVALMKRKKYFTGNENQYYEGSKKLCGL